MNAFDNYVLPLGLLLLGAVGVVVADRAARLRRGPDGDRGDYWARVVQRVCLLLGLLVLLSEAAAVVPDYWQTGRHLEFDLTTVAGWSFPACYRLALLLPFAVWAALLLFGVIERPGTRDSGRWLAGAIGEGNSRLWVLLWALPLAIILGVTLSDLGGGTVAYPAAAWGTLAVLVLSLAGLAFSTGILPVSVVQQVTAAAPSAPQLQSWPEALQSHGLRLRQAASWSRSGPARPVRPSAADLAERLRLRGATGVAPELIEAVADLFNPAAGKEERTRLVLAADSSGQAEAVALAAELLDQRFHATTLVVTAGDADALATELRRWLPAGRRVMAIEPSLHIDSDVLVVVTDAQTLSDQLLPQLKDPMVLKRFGLIVWWQLEAYTGVVAANLWAMSRRLHRLLDATGRQDIRTLAFLRSTPHGEAQPAQFVRRLLPYSFPDECVVNVEPRFPRAVHLHVLESHQDYFARGEGRNIQDRIRHLPLVAAKVSVEEGWPTRLEVPSDVAGAEAEAFLGLPARGAALRDQLQSSSSTAGARVMKIEPGAVLSLVEMIRQGGRTAADGLPHHVGITLPDNPYVAYVLSQLRSDKDFPYSRRLVSAAPRPSVIQRHLLLALDELPDTWSGLRKDFLWSKEIIQDTLEQIAREGKLTRKEVRFLDDDRELHRETEYKSQQIAGGERRPLDTVGASLIEVRHPSARESGDGLLMRVDPERLTIQAYPNRVFLSGGRRYRIREWDSLDQVLRDGWLACDLEEIYSATWRIHSSRVFRIEPASASVNFGSLTRLTASLNYWEEVSGAVWVAPDLTTGEIRNSKPLDVRRPIEQRFATRGLVLRFAGQQDALALASLAQALRHVLPVHLGVEEDALEVVPLIGDVDVQNRPAFGLAIVDLYPGGIGLVDAVSEDNSFLMTVFQSAQAWLAACVCSSDQGCTHCLRSPSARAANSVNQMPSRKAALDLLKQVV
jgi:hypothetical protein